MTNKLYLIYMEQIGSFSFDPNTFELVDIIERLPNETEEQQDERAAYIADRWEAQQKDVKWPKCGSPYKVWWAGVVVKDYNSIKNTQQLNLIKGFPKLPEFQESQYAIWED
jgi:hypothetical protein